MRNIVLIPAYNPDHKLIELINSCLKVQDISEIVVVNDGSAESSSEVFTQISGKVTLLVHPVNQGKGAAIKTALLYISQKNTDVCGIVTVDADGQHTADDSEKLLHTLVEYPESLILGVRTFSDDIPWKSRWGNKITRFIFRLLSGAKVSDTQTGLRAFTSKLIPFLLAVNGDRYEYEMNMLASSAKHKIKITEVPIATIYIDQQNTTSHFRVVRDSLRIYGSLLLYAGTSFLSFLVDYTFFNLFAWIFGLLCVPYIVIIANITARMISASFNYYLNSTYVFDNGRKLKSAIQYFLLAGLILLVNTVIMHSFDVYTDIPREIYKVFTEIILFSASYFIQKLFIFKKS